MRFWTVVLIIVAALMVGTGSGRYHDIPACLACSTPRVVVLAVIVNQPRARISRREETAGIGEM